MNKICNSGYVNIDTVTITFLTLPIGNGAISNSTNKIMFMWNIHL